MDATRLVALCAIGSLASACSGDSVTPTISKVTPSLGPTAGGIPIVVDGSNFAPGAVLTIAGLPVTDLVVSSNSLKGTLPAKLGSYGLVPLSVRNPNDQSHTRSDLFSYYSSVPDFRGDTVPVGSETYGSYAAAAGDFDGDGRSDVAIVHPRSLIANGTVSLWLGDGKGGFPPPSSSPISVGKSPLAIIASDVNNDGKPDLITANRDSNSISVILASSPAGSFAAPVSVTVGTGPYSLAGGDLNGDGRIDLAVANSISNNVSVLLGNGQGGFGPATSVSVGQTPLAVVMVDVDGDTKLDLVTANNGSNSVSILVGDGLGGFAPALSIPVGSKPFSVAHGDVNGDAKPDLAVANSGGESASILLNQGGRTFSTTQVTVPGSPVSTTLADMNGDRRLDLLVASSSSNVANVLLGDGQGKFDPPRTFVTGGQPRTVVSIDLNGDGRLDIVTPNYAEDSMSALLNVSQ